MRRAMIILFLVALPLATLASQEVYAPRVLQSLGLADEQIEEIQALQSETAVQQRRFQADLEIKRAELARMLLDESPDLRRIEVNLRDTADIEVEIRLLEIKREISIREIVGAEAWTRLLSAARAQRETEAGRDAINQAVERLRGLEESISDQQRRVVEQMERQREALNDPELRERLQRLQEEFAEIQRIIREKLQ